MHRPTTAQSVEQQNLHQVSDFGTGIEFLWKTWDENKFHADRTFLHNSLFVETSHRMKSVTGKLSQE